MPGFGLDLAHPVPLWHARGNELSDVEIRIDDLELVVKPIVQPKTWTIGSGDDESVTELTARYLVTLLVNVEGSGPQGPIDRETHLRFEGAAAQAAHRVLKHLREQSRDWEIDVGTAHLKISGYWDDDGNHLEPSIWARGGFRADASFFGGLTGQQWSSVSDRASYGTETDLFEDWLFEAQAFRDAGDPVMAVIAAAVACEIGIVRLLRRHQAKMGISNTDLRELVERRSMETKAALLETHGLIDSAVRSKVASSFKLRNNWLHGNSIPAASSTDVEEAIKAAAQLQARLAP